MITTENTKQEEQRERALATLRQMVANKRAEEKKAIEEYKTNPKVQALVARLDRINAERGTPIT